MNRKFVNTFLYGIVEGFIFVFFISSNIGDEMMFFILFFPIPIIFLFTEILRPQMQKKTESKSQRDDKFLLFILLAFAPTIAWFTINAKDGKDGAGVFFVLFCSLPSALAYLLAGGRLFSKIFGRHSETLNQLSENIASDNLPSEKKIKNDGLRLLIIFGIALLIIASVFIFAIAPSPSLLLFIIAGVGVFGVFKLIQLSHE